MFLLLDARTAGAVSGLGLLQRHVLLLQFIALRTMVFFLKHGFGFDGFEFGLEVGDRVTVRAAIGTTTGVGELVPIILTLLARSAPLAPAQ